LSSETNCQNVPQKKITKLEIFEKKNSWPRFIPTFCQWLLLCGMVGVGQKQQQATHPRLLTH
jgi:hypothetical protein